MKGRAAWKRMPLKYDKLLRVKATPYAVAQGVDVWDERDAKICVENNGGLKSVAYEIVGYDHANCPAMRINIK